MADIEKIKAPEYLHLKPEGPLPPLSESSPFKAVVVVENEVTPEWQGQVSDWLVRSGCRYMMAWGLDCSSWDDSVDFANLKMFDFEEIPEDDFVMTTWHEKEPLEEPFWFAEHAAMHPSLELSRTYIIHIALEDSSTEMLETFRVAQENND